MRDPARNSTILVADDEDLNFILLNEVLSALGIIVLRAENGEKAVELVANREDIDLVLMDLKMPVMDGYEATKIIKKAYPLLPIIALTAYSQDSDREKALSCGCSDFISKPFDRKELIEKMRQLLQ